MRFILAILAGALAVAPAAAGTDRAAKGEAELAKALDGRVAGEPRRCVSTTTLRSSRIIGDTAILWEAANGTIYVNRPRGGASSLDRDDILVTRPFGTQLCSVDVVNLIDRTSFFPSGFVNLGEFVPYAKPRKAD